MRGLSTGITAAVLIAIGGNYAIAGGGSVQVLKEKGPDGDPPGLPAGATCTPVTEIRKGSNDNPDAIVCKPGPNPLKGLHWGLGILHDSSNGGAGDATIITGPDGAKTVRVSSQNKNAARAAFELHYFLGRGANPTFAWGPFISLNSAPVGSITKDSAFSSFGAGLMVGAKVDTAGQHSVNFGVGWLVDTNVRQLAPGIYDGAPTKLTNNEDLFRTKTSQGFMLLLSYNFAFPTP